MWFHVYNRGADRQDLFHDDADHLAFEALLADAVDRFGIEIHAWCQMTNHFHGLVFCPDDVLADTMHRVCGIYGGRYNQRYRRTGPLFDGRYSSKPITSDEQLLQTSRYVHRNPSAIVGDRALAAYRWSTLGAYVGSRPAPVWLHTAFTLELFGGDRAGYRAFVDEERPSEGSQGPDGIVRVVGLDDVERAVAEAAEVPRALLHESRRSVVNQPRLAAILLMSERRMATSVGIASHFGLASPTTARTSARRARVMRESDESFRRLVERAAALLDSRPD